MKTNYTALGIMSGTSLDGLDLALCEFSVQNHTWQHQVIKANTIAYNDDMVSRLKTMEQLSGPQLLQEHLAFGHFIGNEINSFLQAISIRPDLIASHGHTLFHEPNFGFTFQAGHGQAIAIKTGITTISDFRIKDVLLGGQGAPLAPFGDLHLFSQHQFCLNLGGFANITKKLGTEEIIAFDICPVNYVLNRLMQKLGKPFDKNGETARQGILNQALFEKLNQNDFYSQAAPKSLGREWVEKNVFPILDKSELNTTDLVRTYTEHSAFQIAKQLQANAKVLITGGGAFNAFLLEKIKEYSNALIVNSSTEVIDFKEAIIFAFLGVKRLRNEVNCLAQVTGATKNSCVGELFNP